MSEVDSDDLDAFSSTLSFGPPYSGSWACTSSHTPCLTLDRVLRVRRSADGSFVEITCHTRRRRLDRRALARTRWPCAEHDESPPPLYLQSARAP